MDTPRNEISRLGAQASSQLHDAAEVGKQRASAMLDGVSQALAEFADRLDGDNPMAGLTRSGAQQLAGWSDVMRAKSVDEIVEEGRTAIRKSPGAAIGLALAGGFLLSRFLKASAQRSRP